MAELYLFIDESGNFDFSKNGSEYFVLTAVVTDDPVRGNEELLRWRHHILAASPTTLGVKRPRECTHFHCTEDAQYTRDGVFKILTNLRLSVCSVIVQKNKTNPSIRVQDDFYQRAFAGLVRGIVRRIGTGHVLHIFASKFQLKRKEAAFLGALKSALASERGLAYTIYFHPTHSHHMLQASDYFCWAIARKYERGDTRSYALIAHLIEMEFDLFRKGTILYY